MNTFNVQLKNGKQLEIPAEYYPRYSDIVATKENLFCLTPISRLEKFYKTIIQNIFNPVFAVFSVINLSFCAPLLIAEHIDNQKEVYYFVLFMGFIISYYFTKFYFRFIKVDSWSIDGVAVQMGYHSSSSMLKPFDERMLKAIISLNNIKIRRSDLYFDDLYGILFDVAMPRRLHDIFGPTHLKRIK